MAVLFAGFTVGFCHLLHRRRADGGRGLVGEAGALSAPPSGERHLIYKSPFHYSIATRVRNPYFLRFLAPQPGERILDVGCGVGYFVALFNLSGCSVWGVDVDLVSVRAAREQYGQRFAVGRGEELPFAADTFDKLICSEVLEHIKDDARAVSELCRVAKDGATVIVTTPSPEGVFGSRIKSICHGSNGEHCWEAHQREGYTAVELCSLLQDQGMEVQDVRYTMVFATELLMGVTKLAFSAISGRKHLDSQTQVLEVNKSFLMKLYRFVFPVFVLMARLEDLILAPILRGHMVIVRGTVRR